MIYIDYILYLCVCVWVIQVVTQPDVSFCKIVLGRKSLRISTSAMWSWVNEMVCNSTQPCMICILLVVFFFFMFTPIWGNDPILLIFFKGVETTNEYINV